MAGDGNISYSLIGKLNIFTYLQLPCSGVGQATFCGIYLNTMCLLKSCSNLDRCYRKYWKENMNLTFFLYSLASPSLLIQFSSFLFLYIGSINHFANREGELKKIFLCNLITLPGHDKLSSVSKEQNVNPVEASKNPSNFRRVQYGLFSYVYS